MKKEFWSGFILVLLLAFSVSIVAADATDLDGEYLWNHHAPPYDYKFGNMIDSHQQSIVDKTGTSLKGFIYIHNINNDYAEGIPTADKAHCKTQPCMVGWVVKGVKVNAILMQKSPRIWLVAPEDLPTEPGYTHFHWVGGPQSPHDLVVGETYSGFLMKRIAPAPFFWLGGPGTGGGSGGGGGCDGGTHDDGGCSDGSYDDGCAGGGTDTTHTEGGCTDTTHTDGGCSGGGDSGGSQGGGSGRLVAEGVDSHSNIITDEDQLGGHGGCHDD